MNKLTIDDIHDESSELRKSIIKDLDRLSELVLAGQKPFGKTDAERDKEYSLIKKVQKQVKRLGY